MNEFSNKCQVKMNEQFGRYVIASSDIKSGELLIDESPIVIGPYWDSKLCCLNCYMESMTMCKKCKIAPLCLNCIEHDRIECTFLQNAKIKDNFLIDNFNVVTPLRCLYLYENNNTKAIYDDILKMESHCMGTTERREHLLNGKYFYCMCQRCLDPTELQTHLSSIKCKKCNQFNKLMTNSIGMQQQQEQQQQNNALLLFQENEKLWQCNKCNDKILNDEIKTIILNARQEIENNEIDLHGLEEFIFKYSLLLHPNHFIVFELKQKLAAIIRNILDYNQNLNNTELRKLLKRKIEICNDILPIVKILQPGISRLTGIAYYEQFSPFCQLLKMDYSANHITTKQYLTKLLDVEQMAKQSINILIYEPFETPEGQLAKKAMLQLKQIRILIVQLQKSIKENNEENQQQQNKPNKTNKKNK